MTIMVVFLYCASLQCASYCTKTVSEKCHDGMIYTRGVKTKLHVRWHTETKLKERTSVCVYLCAVSVWELYMAVSHFQRE